MVEFNGDAYAINQVLKGLHVVDLHPTKIYCNCRVDNVERVEFLNASFVPDRTCHVKDLGGLPGMIPLLACDACGEPNYARADGSAWNYCPNCGAKVVQS